MATHTSNPPKLPLKLDVAQFADDLARAEYSVGVLEGSQKKLHNPSLLIAPLTAKEAAVSSKIEGTQSTASDVFIYEASGQAEKSDTAEVANYRKAMQYAIEELRVGKPFSLHFIKRLHQMLLEGVRHKGTIGKFREIPVWIAAKAGDPIERAIYIPPEFVRVQEYMENILAYATTAKDRALIKAGLVHYQFEAVHPFEDGNGRIGRLLIPLLLYQQHKLTLPIIYLSGYFEANRDEYIAALHAVDEHHTYEQWMSFFLRAVSQQTDETLKLVEQIYSLHDRVRESYRKLKSPFIIPAIECMFRSPVFTIPMLMKSTKATRLTCANLLEQLAKDGYVTELKYRMGRYKLFAFQPLLQLIR